jgi:hypothetical protein
MTTDAGSGFDNQAAARDAAANLDDLEEESRHLPDDEADAVGDEVGEGVGEGVGAGADDPDEARERHHTQENVNDAF